MQSSSRILSTGVVLVWAALLSPIAAHHSFPAFYEMDTSREIKGRLTRIFWANPHIKIYVAASDGQTWEVEGGPVVALSGIGIKRSMFTIGDEIQVRGHPGRDNARTLWVSNVLLLKKSKRIELLAAPGAQPYPPWKPDEIIGNPKAPDDSGELEADPDRTFFRIWSTLDLANFPKRRREPVLTERGQREQAQYKKKVIQDCEVPGMPFAMVSPYPVEIVQQGNRLLIRGEAYDLRRVVYLDEPASLPDPSPLGLSVGRIMGDELVVKTSRINYHSYGDLGPAQSDQSLVVERFKLSADRLHLDYKITIFDPVMLREPWSWGGKFLAKKGAKIGIWKCGVEGG